MSEFTLQQTINKRKRFFLQQLKENGVFINYCSKRGYVYEIVLPVLGCITRLIVGFKNGLLSVLSMEPTTA